MSGKQDEARAAVLAPAARPIRRLLDLVGAVVGVALLLVVATIPLQPPQQGLFGAGCFIVFLVANRFRGKPATMFLIALSLAVSLRYLFWRATETLPSDNPVALALGVGLLVAESYAVVMLVLGYVQTAWPLERRPIPLPDDPDTWPSVDVYIPTYDEPLEMVRATVLAATAMDWPPDKLHVWLLDDGNREPFRDFAEMVGCGYLTRADNRNAKAGNLNAALARTDGEFVVVFDCDHVPTRAFPQLTLGWMVEQPNLAIVQTPQHFYSPDPFQRNLAGVRRVPPEANMFHGLVQDGNDFWNAAMFSGSCGVLRRAALDDVGGFATETVTEDAHTALKLHRRGWDSAYLRIPLAAGLAPERLARHVRQRRRWARGMIQILRRDNPLFGRGLTLGQRVCYLRASGHFLFALPRVAFLTAPLAFLLLGESVIIASPLAIVAFALPHLLHGVATSSRLWRSWRHSLWGQVYETVLALSLVPVTLTALLIPRRGRFDVTPKGGRLERGFLDFRTVYPNLILAALLLAGVVRGAAGMASGEPDAPLFQALLLNTVWAALALALVLAALAVGREAPQPRPHASVKAALPATIRLPDGREIAGVTRELSQDGGGIMATRPADVADEAEVEVEFTVGAEPLALPARVLRWDGNVLQTRWDATSIEREAAIVELVFGRADAWADWANYPADRPLLSVWRILVAIAGLFRRRRVAPLLLLALFGVSLVTTASAQQNAPRGRVTIRPVPQPVLPFATGQQVPSAPIASPAQAGPDAAAAAAAPVEAPLPPGTRRVIYSLRALGASGPLALRGTREQRDVEFGIRDDEVVTAAELNLTGAMSPALLPEVSIITVALNEHYVASIAARRDQAGFNLTLPLDAKLVRADNQLDFSFSGRYAAQCNDPLSLLLWATVYDTSTLTLTLRRLPAKRELARLPLPFLDPRGTQELTLPFVLPEAASDGTLKAAGIVASWFGGHAASRGAEFPVRTAPPATGNAVMVIEAGAGGEIAGMPPINGPTLAVIANPSDPLSSLLVVAGRDGEETVTAATALVVGSRAMGGDGAEVRMPQLPKRRPYDAPNWMPTDRPVRLGELVGAAELQVDGYVGLLRIPFRTAPDLTTWRDQPFPLRLSFHAPPGPIIDVATSRLDVGINGVYLDSLSLAPPAGDRGWLAGLQSLGGVRPTRPGATVDVPTNDLSGADDLQFYFDARPLHRGECAPVPEDLRMSIDPDSTIDLSGGHRFTELPNLAFFVRSGFPFTRLADLSQTAIVLPAQPSAEEVAGFLDLMGRFGQVTGYPGVGVAVVRPDNMKAVADRDLLLLATLPRLGEVGNLLRNSPLRFQGDRLSLALPTAFDAVRRLFGDRRDAERGRANAVLTAGLADDLTALVGGESTEVRGRSMVAILAPSPQRLAAAVHGLRDPAMAALIQGDLALLSGDRVTSYRAGPTYTVGTLPFWLWPAWALRNQPIVVVVLILAGALLLGLALFAAMRRSAATRLPPRKVKR